MAKLRRTQLTRASQAKPLAPRPTSLEAGADGEVQLLTQTIRQLLRQSGQADVSARAHIGNLLRQVRTRLDHGQWHQWLEHEVPFTRKSADTYIELADFANASPQRFTKVAPLGPTKVYLLMRLPPKLIDQLLAKATHPIASSGSAKSVELMTLGELMEVVGHLQGAPSLPDGADTIINTYRHRVHALVRAIDMLIEHHHHIPAAELEDLHDELLHAAHRLAVTYSLDDD